MLEVEGDCFANVIHSSGSKTQELIKDKDGNPTGTQLTLTNADPTDDGTYKCISANTHGQITRSVQLTVTKPASKRALSEDIGEKLHRLYDVKISTIFRNDITSYRLLLRKAFLQWCSVVE